MTMTSSAYPIEDRARARHAVRITSDLAIKAQQALQRGEQLPPQALQAIDTLTGGINDHHAQVQALIGISDRVRADHLAKLKPLAPTEFNAFCEYINPDEPPESRWHVFLTDTLQDSITSDWSNFILNCPPGHAKPVAQTEPVLMKDGSWAALRDVKIGDSLVTHTGRIAEVTAVHEQGELDCVTVSCKSGRTLTCALDHPVLANGEWVEAQQLRPGDYTHFRGASVYEAQAAEEPDYTVTPQPLAAYRLAGYVLARGARTYFTSKEREYINAHIYHSDTAVADNMQTALDGLGLEYHRRFCEHGGIWYLRLSKDAAEEIAARYDWTALGEDRRVPPWAMTGGRAGTQAYLEAVIDAAGEMPVRYKIPQLRIYLRHADVGRQLQHMFTRIGVPVNQVAAGTTSKRSFVVLGPAAIARLEALGFALPERLQKRIAAKRSYIEPETLAFDGLDEITSIVPAGKHVCRCLTVNCDSSFIAGGLAVHNSTYASRLFVAWRLGRDHNLKIIGGGHSQSFVENEFSKKIRNLVGLPEFTDIFPGVAVDHGSRAANQWGLAGTNGQYVARGVGQGVHGFRANFIVVDDPYAKVEDAESPTMRAKVETWFVSDIGSRILPFGKVFLIMTRFHEEDLTGAMLQLNAKLPVEDQYYHISAPAICFDPETDVLGRRLGEVLWDYYSIKYLNAKKITWKYQRFSLVYQQLADATSEDSVAGKLKYYFQAPHVSAEALSKAVAAGSVDEMGRGKVDRSLYYRRVVASVDTASKKTERADWSVVQIWAETHDGKHYLLDQKRKKVAFPELITMIESLARKWRVDHILVEDKGQGTAYIQARGGGEGQRRLAPAPVVEIKVNSNEGKTFRFDEVSPMIVQEEIVYVPGHELWMDAFVRELGQFPEGAHDDQVDAMTQYLRWAKTNRRRYGTKKVASVG